MIKWIKTVLHLKTGVNKSMPSSSSDSPSTSEIMEVLDLEEESCESLHCFTIEDRPASAKSSNFSTSDYSGKIDFSSTESSSSKTSETNKHDPEEIPYEPVVRRRLFRSPQICPSGDGPLSSPTVRLHVTAQTANMKMRCFMETRLHNSVQRNEENERSDIECSAQHTSENTSSTQEISLPSFQYLGMTQYLGQQAYEKGNDGDVDYKDAIMNIHIRVFNPNAYPPVWGTTVHHFNIRPNETMTDLVLILLQKEGVTKDTVRLEYIPYPGRVIHVDATRSPKSQGIPPDAILYFHHRLLLPSNKPRSRTTMYFQNFANSSSTLTEVST